jgi:hypothetical protein
MSEFVQVFGRRPSECVERPSSRQPKTYTDSDIGGSPIRRGSRSGVGEIIAARRKKQNGLGGAN